MTRRIYEKPVLIKRDALPLVAAEISGGTDSDRRLKTGIMQVGMLRAGIPLYRFRYIGRKEIHVGVMAQDVLPLVPEAVITDAAGFMRIDYARLGTRMMTLAEWEAGGVAEQEARSAAEPRDREENQEARSAAEPRDRDARRAA